MQLMNFSAHRRPHGTTELQTLRTVSNAPPVKRGDPARQETDGTDGRIVAGIPQIVDEQTDLAVAKASQGSERELETLGSL